MQMKWLRQKFKGVSWRNPVINFGFKVISIPDMLVRQITGLGHLPKYSVRVRSRGVANQFGGQLFSEQGEFIKEKHLKYKPGLRDKTVQIYNFVNIMPCSEEYPQGSYYLYAGRLSREKGVMTLVKAWKHLPDKMLKIAGDGPLKEEIARHIRKNDQENIELMGHLSGQRLFDLIKNSRYLIVPSESYENNPMSVLEAFANGKPVIGANIGGIPELIKDRVNGFLFQSNNIDSLVEVIQSTENISNDKYTDLSREAIMMC